LARAFAPSDLHKSEQTMTTHRLRVPNILAFTLISILAFAFSASAEESEIALPGDRAYPESISSGPDNSLYVGSLATGGVWLVKPETGTVEPWIKPAAFGTRSILGVLVDGKANMLWDAQMTPLHPGFPVRAQCRAVSLRAST